MDRFCACGVAAAPAKIMDAAMRVTNFIVSSYGLKRILPHAQSTQGFRAALLRSIAHPRVQALAMAVHGDDQRAEGLDAKLPQRLRVEVVEVDVLDGLDPGRLERRGAADDGELNPAQVHEGIQ